MLHGTPVSVGQLVEEILVAAKQFAYRQYNPHVSSLTSALPSVVAKQLLLILIYWCFHAISWSSLLLVIE